MGYGRKRRSEIIGMRLKPDAVRRLDLEAERSGRYPATIVSELILIHLPPDREEPRKPRAQTAGAQ